MQVEQLHGGKTEIADAAFQELRTAFRGAVPHLARLVELDIAGDNQRLTKSGED